MGMCDRHSKIIWEMLKCHTHYYYGVQKLTFGVAKFSGFSFSSSMTSKYCVSMSPFSSGTTGGTCWRIFSHVQESFLKNKCLLTSAEPFLPNLVSLQRDIHKVDLLMAVNNTVQI